MRLLNPCVFCKGGYLKSIGVRVGGIAVHRSDGVAAETRSGWQHRAHRRSRLDQPVIRDVLI